MTALLEVRGLGVTAGPHTAPVTIVDDVSFTMERGEVLGLAGESGSGKTMTALALMGILPAQSRATGEVRLGDEDVLKLRGRALRQIQGRRIAMVFQDPSSALHPMLTIGRQMTEHTRHHLGIGRRDSEQRALDLLDQVRIPDPRAALKAFPHQFSGGMRQRIQIAIALACEPDVLIADEPTTALDVTIQAGVLRLLDGLRRDRGLAVLLITHDLGLAAEHCERIVVMHAGHVVESAPTAELFANPRHPYTAKLIAATPRRGVSLDELAAIPGGLPDLRGDLPACRYRSRCERYAPFCDEPLPVQEPAQGHTVACWKPL